jgi:hypothetical protein
VREILDSPQLCVRVTAELQGLVGVDRRSIPTCAVPDSLLSTFDENAAKSSTYY